VSLPCKSAFFLSESEGFIVGSSKTLMKTLDGGDTWKNIDLGIDGLNYNISLTNIYFVSDLIGFISGNRGEIIKTIDGGDSWTLISKLEFNINIVNLFFQDENIGYALTEGYLYKTIDGGSNWNNENIEYYYSGFHGISFNNDGNKSVLVGNGTSCCTGYSTGHIIYTKELENDWVNKSYLSLRSYPIVAVYMEEDIGFIFGNNYGAKTIDGGLTWKSLTPPEPYIYQVEVLNNNIFLLGQNSIYKSTDSGETWAILNTSHNFRELYFINEQTIYAISNGTGVFKTIDGGLNWINVSTEPAYGLNLNFINENEGYIGVVNDGMFKTLDGGNTWTQIPLEFIDGYLNVYSIDFNNNIGFAASSAGLLKTLDGGNNWVHLNIYMGGTVKFIQVINEFEWFAITDDRVLKTNDGGLNWKTEYYGGEISNVYFSNEKLYLVGYRNFTEIATKSPPNSPGYIQGNHIISSQSIEEYSVNKDMDVYYKWTVSGDNEINYNENKAEILWKSPGTYTVTVTPFNNCGDGTAKEIIVTVEEDWDTPIITGEIEVDEFSLNNEYFTSFSDNSRYNWFVKGHEGYNDNINNISINWGEYGVGKIEVIETKINSGKRKKGYLDVAINSLALSIDDFEIETNGIIVFPNPTNGIFDIALPISLKEVKISIFSTNSQIVSTGTYSVVNHKVRMNINNLPVGMYFVKVHLETPESLRIIKK